MLLDNVAFVDLTLPLETYKGRVNQDDTANGGPKLARRYSSRHAAHRMTEQNRSGKPQGFDESKDVACMVAVPVPV